MYIMLSASHDYIFQGYPMYIMLSQSMIVWNVYLETLASIVTESKKLIQHCIHGSSTQFTAANVTSKISGTVHISFSQNSELYLSFVFLIL